MQIVRGLSFIIGLWGKTCENKIRNLEVKTDDSEVKETFDRYLEEWGEPRLQLSE